jgi:hypothetical protein
MKLWSRAIRIVLALAIATQSTALLPALAASQGSKPLAVKAIGEAELKSEFGAGGGGGGGDPVDPPPGETCSLSGGLFATSNRLTIQCGVVSIGWEQNGTPTYVGSSFDTYGPYCVNQANPSYTNSLNTSCEYEFKTGTQFEVSGGYSGSVEGTFRELVQISGGFRLDGSLTLNWEQSTTRSVPASISPRTYQYLRPKYKFDKYLKQYAVYKTYSNGLRERLTPLVNLTEKQRVQAMETTICDVWGNNCTVY